MPQRVGVPRELPRGVVSKVISPPIGPGDSEWQMQAVVGPRFEQLCAAGGVASCQSVHAIGRVCVCPLPPGRIGRLRDIAARVVLESLQLRGTTVEYATDGGGLIAGAICDHTRAQHSKLGRISVAQSSIDFGRIVVPNTIFEGLFFTFFDSRSPSPTGTTQPVNGFSQAIVQPAAAGGRRRILIGVEDEGIANTLKLVAIDDTAWNEGGVDAPSVAIRAHIAGKGEGAVFHVALTTERIGRDEKARIP